MKNDERLSGDAARPSAQPEFGQSTIDRAVEHVYRTVSPEILTRTARGPGQIVNDQSQRRPRNGSATSRLRFGRQVGARSLLLTFRLCLAVLLLAAVMSAVIFVLTQPSGNKTVAKGTPAKQVPDKAGGDTLSTATPAVLPPATGVVQSAAVARPAPAAAPPKSEANSAARSSPFAVLPSGKPTQNTTPRPAEPISGVASIASPAGPPSPSPKLRFSAAEIAVLLARGDASLATGDVASARLFFEFAADSGDARAAVRLGETFDPLFLNQPLLRRVPGDLGKAVLWYRHARNLGVTEVERRLKTLETKQGG